MTADQFRVVEYYSYDMMATWCRTKRGRNYEAISRMFDSLEYMVGNTHPEIRLFPDYQFNAQEFAKR